jgi:hypothetical protein
MARQSAARALQQTEVRLGIDGASSLKGITPNPLIAEPHRRTPKTAPTSNRIPGSVAAKDRGDCPRDAPESRPDRSGLQQGSPPVSTEH